MRSPGFSLVEVVIALAVTSVMVLAVASFYTQMVGAWSHGQLQVSLRRQANLVEREMGRIIGPALGLPPGSCGPAPPDPDDAASLPVELPAGALPDPDLASGGFVCFYRDPPPSDLLMRCRFVSLASTACIAGSEANLLGGAPTTAVIRLENLTDTGTDLTTRGLAFIRTGGTTVDVSFNLSAFDPGDPARRAAGPMSFSTRFGVRG
jgi:prepilin-type N-terminal cleavage/methylation domain-containing protein